MAQTTGAMSGAAGSVEYSFDAESGTAATWVNISGYAASVEVSGGEAVTGQQLTLDGDAAIVTAANKINPYTITVNAVFTETDSEPFDALYDRYTGATKTAAFRWSPAGGGTGDVEFSTTDSAGTAAVNVPITACTPPGVDASSGDPRMFTVSFISPDILKAAAT